MISLDEATVRIRANAAPLGVERVDLERACGRLVAGDITARGASPARCISAMDGFAVAEADFGPQGARLEIVGVSKAGLGYAGELKPGACVRIFTGAPVPAGADRVIMQEDVLVDGLAARFSPPSSAKRHIRPCGSDFMAGEVLVAAGQRLTAQAMVAAAAADQAQVDVWRQPRVMILSTGDELAAPGQAGPSADTIPDSVSFGVAALVRAWGGRVIGRQRLDDDLPGLRRAAAAALEAADLVVVTGGASVGDHDLARPMFEPMELVFAKVAMKPGKPVWFARSRGGLVLGLPGNPTAAMVTARLLLAPLLAGLGGGDASCALGWRGERLALALPEGGEREQILLGRMMGGVQPLTGQDSSGQKALARTDLLIRRPARAPARERGETVQVLAL